MLAHEITAVFFDLGDTLGTPVLSPPPLHLIGFTPFPFASTVLRDGRARGLRLGIISNTGDDAGPAVDRVLASAGLLPFFDDDLRIYSRDVGLTKNSPAIFRLAAERAGLADQPRRCLFVGEDAKERGFALDAGWTVAPHPLLIDEVLAGQALRYVRIVAPPHRDTAAWLEALRARPVVPHHRTGRGGATVYATTSQRRVAELMDMQFEVEPLGGSDAPLRTELYILRDDAAATSGFLSPTGEASRLFSRADDAQQVLRAGADGIVVALRPERSLEEFHFAQARHGHTLKLLADPSLLEPFRADDPLGAPEWLRTRRAGFGAPDLSATATTELSKISAQALVERAERYGGRRPLSATSAETIPSRHVLHPGNDRAVAAVAEELQAVGQGRLTVRLHRFTHGGRPLYNVEAELPGTSAELVLVTAHLDSTAAFSSPYDAEHDPAPGVDDDASGVAAVLTIAEHIVALAQATPLDRTLRFVLFNAEEHGLVGSKVYARQQKLLNAPIVAVFQMDMVGYNHAPPRSWEVHVGYAPSVDVQGRSLALARLLGGLTPRVSPRLDPPQIYTSDDAQLDPAEGRSDHASFHACGYAACVATEDFFTGPQSTSPAADANPNYHKKDDIVIDGDLAADIARVIAAAAWVTAHAPSLSGVSGSPHDEGGPPMPRELDTRRTNANLAGRALSPSRRSAALTDAAPAAGTRTNPLTAAPVTVSAPAVAAPERSLVEKAMAFVQRQNARFGFGPADPVEFAPDPTVQFTSVGAASVHLQQYYRGLPIFQMARTVRFAPGGHVTDASGDSAPVPAGVDTEPKLDVVQAVMKAAEHLASTSGEEKKDGFGTTFKLPTVTVEGFQPAVVAGFPLVSRPTVLSKGPFENLIPAYLLVFYHPVGARVAWHVTLTLPNYEDQYIVIVAADDRPGEILYSKSTMHRVLARGNVYEHNPQDTPRRWLDFPRPLTDYPVMLTTPLVGFPAHWIGQDEAIGNATRATLGTSTTTLRGVPRDGTLEFNPGDAIGDDQKMLNIFYFCNYMHDFLYLLGFDEAAGNFQEVNFTNTGLGRDPVRAHAHSGPVNGVANMYTPPDGLPPLMNMGLYAPTQRHTAFDADVVFHEFTHGLTNRLVGGRVNEHALDAAQSSGMGEGWSDFFALTVQNFFRAPGPEKVVTGSWVTNRPGGIRSAPYDENYPLKYGDIVNMSDEHDIGEIWCAALMQMTRNIRRALGSDQDGYRLAWQIVADGLKLTHANPSCLDARDAILRALDDLNTAGRLPPQLHAACRRACWEAFARFGMGYRASSDGPNIDGVVADESLPPDV